MNDKARTIPEESNARLLELGKRFMSDVAREVSGMETPHPDLLTAEAYSMAVQAIFGNAHAYDHDTRQVFAGVGAGIGTVLGEMAVLDSITALALTLKAINATAETVRAQKA